MRERLVAVDGLRRAAVPGLVAVALVLAAAVYAPQVGTPLSGGDEFTYIRQGELIAHQPAYWARAYLTTHGRLWLPTVLSLAPNALLAGRHPAGWRAVNLGIHAANVLLLFALVLTLTRRRLPAALAAALFALWPAGWAAVAWIAGRVDGLMTAAMLATLLCWVRWRSGWRTGYPLALGFLALALTAKETAVGLAAVLAGYEWLLAPRPHPWRALAPPALLVVAVEAFLVWHLGTTTPQVSRGVLSNICTLLACWAGTWGVMRPHWVAALLALAVSLLAGWRMAAWAGLSAAAMLALASALSFAAGLVASWHLYAASVFPCAVLGLALGRPRRVALAGLLLLVGTFQVHRAVTATCEWRAHWQPLQAGAWADLDSREWTAPVPLARAGVAISQRGAIGCPYVGLP